MKSLFHFLSEKRLGGAGPATPRDAESNFPKTLQPRRQPYRQSSRHNPCLYPLRQTPPKRALRAHSLLHRIRHKTGHSR